MNSTLVSINRLLSEVAAHLQAGTATDKSAATAKLHQISTQATTLAITIKVAP